MRLSILVLLLVTSFSCAPALDKISELNVKENNVYEIIQTTVSEAGEIACGTSKSIFILNVEKDGNQYSVKISGICEDEINFVIAKKRQPLVGFLKFHENILLVFGENYQFFFQKSDKNMQLKFIDQVKVNEIKNFKGQSSYIFEPMVWLYYYRENDFIFQKKGMLDILN